MQIERIQSTFGDNWFYLLHAEDGSDGLLIDPVDADAALARVRALGVTVRLVVNTHSHYDHTAGNAAVLQATGAQLAALASASPAIPGVQRHLQHGDHLSVGAATLQVLATPGHTLDHLSLYTPGHLFCGDTIFVGGAGNCRFGGDPHALAATFRALAALPDDTLIYPGHDYSVRNLEFCLHHAADNPHAARKLDAARANRPDHLLQSTLAEEKTYSPFFRADDPSLQRHLQTDHPDAWSAATGHDDAERAFVAVRALRNSW